MSRTVAILGMHRSGTSWLTGSLEEAGLALGDVKTESRHNPKGNRESELLQQLHEAVLEDNGGSWRRPAFPNGWSERRSLELRTYIDAMNTTFELWGFKDPRALLLLDEWHRQVPGLQRVGVFRHPIAVYRSLVARNKDFKEKEAIRLWMTYNERLLAEHEREPFTVLRFDVDPAMLHAHLEVVAKELDLSVPPGEFFDAGFVHNASDERVPVYARDVWTALEEIALR